MNYYGYSDKKSKYKGRHKKLWFNILIIILIITATVAFSLVLGNVLKKKLDNADISTEPIEHITDDTTEDTTYEYQTLKNDRTYEELATIAGYLDLDGATTENDAESFVNNLKSTGYTGIYFDVRNSSGELTFASEAASSLINASLSSELIPVNILKAAVTTAKQNGMRVGAGLKVDNIFGTDEASAATVSIYKYIVKELYDMGFDEVILSGIFTTENFSSDTANSVFDYISSIREMCPGIDIGMVIDLSIIENPEMTPAIELLFHYTDFFAADFTDGERYTDEEILSVLDRLSGSFSAYCIRALSNGESVTTIQEKYALFSSDGYVNLSFITPSLDIQKPEQDEADEEQADKYTYKIFSYSLIPVIPEQSADSSDDTQSTDN